MTKDRYNQDIFDDRTVDSFVESELNGFDYDIGQIEVLASSNRNIRKYLGNLTKVLLDKGVLTEKEIFQMIHGYEFKE